MPSPFPGMNPYLEHPELWPGLHTLLIGEIAKSLAPQLRPKYRVAVEVRMYETTGQDALLIGIPDLAVKRPLTKENSTANVAVTSPPTQPAKVVLPMGEMVKQAYLEVREVATSEVVTAIELLSPINKRSGRGREAYENKRQQVLGSATNLVEIDLLRRWQPMPILSNGLQAHYRILVSRSKCRPEADLYTFNLQDPIATFPLPLKPEDQEPRVDLQVLLDELYEQAGYDLAIDYAQEIVPSLSETDAVWADEPLRQQGLR